MIDDPETLLKDLRWDVDMVVTNPFGERVWLKAAIDNGKRIGITECCPEHDPCPHHAAIAACRRQAARN
jgi:hypothetical protein